MPAEATPQLTVANGVSLPIEEMNLHIDPATYDALVEQGKREYYAEKAAEAKAAREAEAAQWEPMPIPPGASRLLAALYGNMLRRKQPSPAAEPDSQAGAAMDSWEAWSHATTSAGAAAASTGSGSALTSGGDAAPSSPASFDTSDDKSETDFAPSSSRASRTTEGASQTPAASRQSLVSSARTTSGVESKPPTSRELAVALTNVAAETSATSANANLPKTPSVDDDARPQLNTNSKSDAVQNVASTSPSAPGEQLAQALTDPFLLDEFPIIDRPTVPFPSDPQSPPGEGWEFRGPPGKGNWYNPKTRGSLHPDLDHPPGVDPHWD